MKGLVLDLRNDPGGLLDGAVALSAAFLPGDVTVVSTNGQIAESKATFKAAPEYYIRRGGPDPLKQLPAAHQDACRWWCWSTRARPRPARSSPARCKTTSARS